MWRLLLTPLITAAFVLVLPVGVVITVPLTTLRLDLPVLPCGDILLPERLLGELVELTQSTCVMK